VTQHKQNPIKTTNLQTKIDKRFIETPHFPINEINKASAKEKDGGGRPPHWNMVFWWTRKPLASARAIIAGALLPADTNPAEFKHNLRLNEKTPHAKNPHIPPSWKEKFSKAKLLDPFAGFGSIPLEAIRLNIGEAVALDLLPTAYVFLKAILEYPKWAVEQGIEKQLIKDLERWGKWITEKLKEDPDIKELYDDNTAVYIGTWEIKCPHCGRWTPLVGNWWLARVPKRTTEEEDGRSGIYKRLAWMEPVKVGDHIKINIIDLNKKLKKNMLKAKVNAKKGIVTVEGKEYNVPTRNVQTKYKHSNKTRIIVGICLHCNNKIEYEPDTGEEYIKSVMREWNQKIEQYLSGQIDLQTFRNTVRARPKFLAKIVIDKNLEFKPALDEDQEKIWKALEKLRLHWGDVDIPTEPVPFYETRSIWVIGYGFDKWFKLFNPRQLLVLLKIVKLIRQIGKNIEKEKRREGWDKEKAYKYAEAIATYLAIALVRFADYNCINTMVDTANPRGIKVAHAFSTRGIAMQWNWGDTNPRISSIRISGILQDTSTLYRSLRNSIEGLSYIISAVSSSNSVVKVMLDDATIFNNIKDKKFNIIITDPPYRDDVPYAELSDFYYVWLKRALSDVIDFGGLAIRQPRFVPEAFFKNGVEIEVQWKYFASKEISEDEGRSKFFGENVGNLEHFKRLLIRSFQSMARRLVNSGVLVTYYAHTSAEAWEALLEAGWKGAGLQITAAHAVITESKLRVTARGKAGLDVSIVAVWRKGVSGQVLSGEAYSEALDKCTKYANVLRKNNFEGVDLFVGVLGCVLSVFTKYERVVGVKSTKELVEGYVYPATAEVIARVLGSGEFAGRFSGASLFYLLGKVLVSRKSRHARRVLDRSTVTILAIGTRSEQKVLQNLNIIKPKSKKKDSGYILVEPPWSQSNLKRAARAVLDEKGIRLENPVVRSAVDLLHILEYYAVSLPKGEFVKRAEELRARYPALYEEALGLAQVLAEVLPQGDPERELAGRVVAVLAPKRVGLEKWLQGGE